MGRQEIGHLEKDAILRQPVAELEMTVRNKPRNFCNSLLQKFWNRLLQT